MSVISRWPNDVAYLDAIQAPSVCFTDPRLKAALICTNKSGMPLAATGRSAIVFRADVDSEDVAIRCFTRAAEGQQKRYQDLHEYLSHSMPNYMVDFKYWDREILVKGTRYPVLEMDWAEGRPLHSWVEQHLESPYSLLRLAAIWLKVVNDLQARRMAHGDLSSDNCLVTGHKLTLIDYDDFFISPLAGSNPGEAGNPHFQHPDRPGYYALNMDNFPALVIYLSLLALATDRSLWRFHNGKNLIFTADDYKAPGATPLWEALAKNPDQRIKPLVTALAEMCAEPIEDLPPLSQLTTGSSAPWWLTPAAWRSLIPGGAHESASQRPDVPSERSRGSRRRAAWVAAGAAGLALVAILLTLVVGSGSAAAPAVNSAGFSAGGNTLAAGNTDGSIYLWDVRTKTHTATLKGPTSRAINSAAFSPDGATLAAGSADGNTYLWDVPAKTLTATLKSPTSQAINSAAFSPDGTTLAAGSADGNTYLWDVPAKTLTATLKSPTSQGINSAAFSPDGTTLAAGSADGSIYLWDVSAKTLTATLKGPTGRAVNSAAFSPDGKTLAAANADGNTYLWDVPANSLTYAVPDPDKGAVVSVAFSPGGTTLATADAGGSISLWDLPAKSLTATLPNPGKRAVVSVAFSLGGTTVAIVDAGGVVYLWNVSAKPPS
jgi:sugar lactone lactonase YvrE